MQLAPAYKTIFKKALEKSSLKPTKQREHIFSLILNKKDHARLINVEKYYDYKS